MVLKEEKPTVVEGTLGSQRSHVMSTSLLIVNVLSYSHPIQDSWRLFCKAITGHKVAATG